MNTVLATGPRPTSTAVQPVPLRVVIPNKAPSGRLVTAAPRQSQTFIQPAPVRTVIASSPEAGRVVLAGNHQGRRGLSAFEQWLGRNPGGTWEEFMAEVGTGAFWNTTEW